MNLMAPALPTTARPDTSDYRSLFPLVEQCVYLNSNSTGATPRPAKLVLRTGALLKTGETECGLTG